MQRICSSLHTHGFDILLVGRHLVTDNLEFPFPHKRIKCWFNSGILFYTEYNIRLFIFLLFAKMDVLCSIDLDTLLSGRIASLLRNKKQIYDAHEYFTESPELDDRPVVKKIWEGIARITIPYVHSGYTVNNSIADFLSDRYGKELSVIRNFPEIKTDTSAEVKAKLSSITSLEKTDVYHGLQSANSNQKQQDLYLLYQGVLNKGRGLEALIKSFHQIPDIPLWIAGDGDIKKELEELALRESLSDRIKFLGKLAPAKLKEVTKNATVGYNLLDPSNKNYYFSLANKYFDYMMAGVPSISMNFPEYALIHEDIPFSVLIDTLSIDAIVEATLTLLNNEDRYKKIQANCFLARQKYNWQMEEKQLLEFYKNLSFKQ